MKGKLCFGVLLLLFIIFGLSLSVCSDVNALILTSEVEPTGGAWTVERVNCSYTNGGFVQSSTSYCRVPLQSENNTSQNDLTKISPNFTIPAKEGFYYKTYLSVKSDTGEPELIWRVQTNSNDWNIAVFQEVVNDSLYTPIINTNSSGGSTSSGISPVYSKFYEVVLYAKRTGDLTWSFGNGVDAVIFNSRYLQSYPDNNTPLVTLYTIEEFKPISQDGSDQLNRKDDEDRQNLESQSSNTDSASDSSASDAESTGTTLLSAFTAFVGALTNASPSNCNIDMDLGNLDLGVVNLCQLSLPAGFQALASIFLILFCVPLSIATARKVISLFRSFQ